MKDVSMALDLLQGEKSITLGVQLDPANAVGNNHKATGESVPCRGQKEV